MVVSGVAMLAEAVSMVATVEAVSVSVAEVLSALKNNVQPNANAIDLVLELSVVRACDQFFEYFNCHPRTGMLNAVGGLA